MALKRTKPRILAAGTQPAFAVLCDALDGSADVLAAESLSRAAWLLGAKMDLVLCTLRADEPRLFDFLRLAEAAAPRVPVVCCRLLDDGPHGAPATQAVTLAARAAGVDEYLDLVELRREHGIEAGDARFRAALLRRAALKRGESP